jgi:hypothetical protein
MKNRRFFAICIVLFSAVFALSCDTHNPQSSSVKSFSNDLRGTWESNDKTNYSGSLTIDFDTIKIDGYDESQTKSPQDGGDDKQRPFVGFPRKTHLRGYSEDGKIFIDYGNGQNGIPYTYTNTETGTYPYKRILEFDFGGRKEILNYQN